MLQFSYYGAVIHPFFPKNKRIVSVSRSFPSDFGGKLEQAHSLMPSYNLLDWYKKNIVSASQYIDIYKTETLSILSPKEIYTEYKDSVLLCYETPNDFCHRQVISQWLAESGYISEEVYLRKVKIAVIGGREYSSFDRFSPILDRLLSNYAEVSLVSGGARGADSLAERYAAENNLDITVYHPDWEKGRHAGFERNKKIISECDICIAFWDGKSKGTAHSIDEAVKQDKRIYICDTNTHRISMRNFGKYGSIITPETLFDF